MASAILPLIVSHDPKLGPERLSRQIKGQGTGITKEDDLLIYAKAKNV